MDRQVETESRRAFAGWYLSAVIAFAVILQSCGDTYSPGPEPGIDTTPPFVVSIIPAAGSFFVSRHATVSVTLSEPPAPATVNTESFALLAGSLPVAGTIAVDAVELTFTPTDPLDFATTFTVTISTAVADTAGNRLASDYNSSFTTATDEMPHLSETAIGTHISILASDSLRGRRAGSGYERLAAEYIRERFQLIGLQPAAPDYFQAFTIPVPVDQQTGLTSQNVLGVLPGTGGLAGQWVVIGAHYDHMGFLPVSDDSLVVFNGADDNASGTALLLELSRALGEFVDGGNGEDRRSIMFQAYGAEEVGLIGSFHYCGNPTTTMDSVVAMINLDMVGRLRDDVVTVIGAGSSSGWNALLTEANVHDLTLIQTEEFLNRSDQYCFYQQRRPVLFLHTGLHEEYHTPLDDAWMINGPGMVEVGDLAAGSIVRLLTQPDPLVFDGVIQPTVRVPGEFNHLGTGSFVPHRQRAP